jgi:hypothetical protein
VVGITPDILLHDVNEKKKKQGWHSMYVGEGSVGSR